MANAVCRKIRLVNRPIGVYIGLAARPVKPGTGTEPMLYKNLQIHHTVTVEFDLIGDCYL